MIKDLLPAYYAAYGTDPSYTVIRSIVISGHEAAWMELKGTVQFDITGRGREGEPYVAHGFYCECDFAEGVGWKKDGDSVVTLMGPEKCLCRKAAMHLRHLELRQEYLERYKEEGGDYFALRRHVPDIIIDLIEKVKAGEFVEDGSGAEFWGGYFYLQTVARITDQFLGHLWEDVHRLCTEKKISLDGAVITPYREPPPPLWVEALRIEDAGWVGIASVPGHRWMALEARLEVLKPDDTPAYEHIPGLSLMHAPEFGIDAEDLYRIEEKLVKLIEQASKKAKSES